MLWIVLLLVLGDAQGKHLTDDYQGPVIGILTQSTYKISYLKALGDSYLAASYVKYIEMAGAQVIPIYDGWDLAYIKHIMQSINGVLLPGGAQTFPTSRYYVAAKHIYEWAEEMNDKGGFFPIWGTCLGYELMTDVAANKYRYWEETRFNCSSLMSNNLTLYDDAQSSRLLSNIDTELYHAIQREKVVFNAHHWCLSPDMIRDPEQPLHKEYDLLATDYDEFGVEYVALIEHKSKPFYASQFHPEKASFEWAYDRGMVHTKHAIEFEQYLANFFINEAKKNRNQFSNPKEFYALSINNFHPMYALKAVDSAMETIYFWNEGGRLSRLEKRFRDGFFCDDV